MKKYGFGFIVGVFLLAGCGAEDHVQCEVYFDGCNTCQVGDSSDMICTERVCSPEEMKEPGCVEFRDIVSKETVYDQTDLWNMEINYPDSGIETIDQTLRTFIDEQALGFRNLANDVEMIGPHKHEWSLDFDREKDDEQNTITYQIDIRQSMNGEETVDRRMFIFDAGSGELR